MLKALNPLTASWYTPLSERENDSAPTQFLIRPLSGVERFEVEMRRDEGGHIMMTERGGRAVLRYGLRGWKNFHDDAGPVAFDDHDPDKNLARLDLGIAAELASEVWIRSTLTEEQRKNLLSPPTSPVTPSSSDAAVASGGGIATTETRPDSASGQSPA